MKSQGWLAMGLLLLGATAARAADGGALGEAELAFINHRLHGQIVDHTNHHGADHRFWSAVLCLPRNMYVYLPPGYDPCQSYPLLLWLHGYAEQERAFARRIIVPFDRAIASGKMPPTIIAAPSGYLPGKRFGSMFLNTRQGNCEDYIINDVLPFLQAHYPIRPEREAHAIAGLSGGGWAAYTLGLRYRNYFGVIVGLIPTVNMRWLDCHCNYRSKFDPCCWGWRTQLDKHELIGIYYGLPVTFKSLIEPFWGWGPEALAAISADNPIELLERYCIRDGELTMLVCYIGHDQLHADAQVESFVCMAQQLGIGISVNYQPTWRGHNVATGIKFLPSVAEWLGPVLAPYSPPLAHACPPLPEPQP